MATIMPNRPVSSYNQPLTPKAIIKADIKAIINLTMVLMNTVI